MRGIFGPPGGVLDALARQQRASERAVLPFIFSADGRMIGPGYEPPTLSEIARGLGKICRFAGNSRTFWPVLLHSMLVADQVGPEIEVYALLHDAAEVVFNDTPTPFKPQFFEAREQLVLNTIWEELVIPAPSASVWERIKVADRAALHAEAAMIGPSGLAEYLGEHDTAVEALLLNYLHAYKPEDYITEGRATADFQLRVRRAVARVRGA